jgi:SAM-dependent methyltransferase
MSPPAAIPDRGAERRGLRRRAFAWAMHTLNGGYEAQVAARKRALFSSLVGTVAEIGPGTGANFALFPEAIRWIGIEPNAYAWPYLERAARGRGIEAEVRSGLAEGLPLENGSVDAVIGTLVLCSVDSLERTLGEIRRVLRPGGRYVFVEHVAAEPGTGLRRVQRFARPVSRWLGDGCHPDRDTAAAIERAGFAKLGLERANLPLGIYSPHIFGVAVR